MLPQPSELGPVPASLHEEVTATERERERHGDRNRESVASKEGSGSPSARPAADGADGRAKQMG